MIGLKLLSFQGISRIERLDDVVCKLQKLIIMDLRACYNLEKLSEKIDSLKALIYLDITVCYVIDRMPKRLSWLDNLEVLKGFVVSDATDEETVCTLAELKHLEKLRKLSITINKEDFGVDNLIEAIKKFESLEKLKKESLSCMMISLKLPNSYNYWFMNELYDDKLEALKLLYYLFIVIQVQQTAFVSKSSSKEEAI